MNCVVLQPSYIPWRGYFHQIQKADVFVFYDDVQFDKHGWRNRNRIKTTQGPHWLTIPVHTHGNCADGGIPIDEILIDNRQPWSKKHWETIRHSYARAPYFARYADWLRAFYEQKANFLAEFTIALTVALAGQLGIAHTRFVRSSSLGVPGRKTQRLVDILLKLGATHYVSGPSARGYLDEDVLRDAGLTIEFMAYDYREYAQLYPPFDPFVSILDLLFMTGPEAPRHIWQPALDHEARP